MSYDQTKADLLSELEQAKDRLAAVERENAELKRTIEMQSDLSHAQDLERLAMDRVLDACGDAANMGEALTWVDHVKSECAAQRVLLGECGRYLPATPQPAKSGNATAAATETARRRPR